MKQLNRHLKIIVGNWKVEDWHLYRYTQHCSAKRPNEIRWMMWDRVL